jgi:hypothetical protein
MLPSRFAYSAGRIKAVQAFSARQTGFSSDCCCNVQATFEYFAVIKYPQEITHDFYDSQSQRPLPLYAKQTC